MTRSKYIYNKITYSIRKELEELLHQGVSQHQASKDLSISRSTISREIKRCGGGKYDATKAQLDADEKKISKDQSNKNYRNKLVKRIEDLEGKVYLLLSIAGILQE